MSLISPPFALIRPVIALTVASAPPRPMTMPKAWFAIDLEIGEERAARNVGREIEMHAPRGHHRLQLGLFEMGVEEIARG